MMEENEQADQTDQTLSKLSLISLEDQSKLLNDFQGNYLDYDKSATFLDLFAKQVQQRSDAIALVDASNRLTYGQTNAYTDQLARKLVSLGVKANSFVGIMLPRQKEFMLSVLAIMKASGAYLPLDSSYPQERIEYMLNDSEAQVLITQRTLFEEKGGYDSFRIKHILFIEESDFLAAAEDIPPVELTQPLADDLAYMIYTSGSTGKPKGVMIRHKSLAAFLAWRVKDYGLTCEDNIGCHSSFSFDASVYDLFAPLVVGGQLHIISEDMRYDMRNFAEYIRANKISDCSLATQFGMELLRQFDVPLKTISLGGEKLQHVPKRNLRLINSYGPTEFTIASNYYDVNQEQDYNNIPIGKPVPNSWAYVVDSNNALLPIGTPGELCLAGFQIAKGYWHREDLTEEKFVDNPYTTCEDNAKMYRTGDLVRWNENGELEYLGRIDNQVKLRGYRIELGEIEVAIAKFNSIIDSVVDIKEINSVQHLCGYFTAPTPIDVNELKKYLSDQLTEYMVPTVLMQINKLPLTPNGKIDKKALPNPVTEQQEIIKPQTNVQQQLFAMIADLLGTEDFGISTDLFTVGMTSLIAIKITVAIYNEFKVNVKSNEVIKGKTIATLEELIQKASPEQVEICETREFYPLTANQIGIYYDCGKEPESLKYNIPCIMKFSHQIAGQRLKDAVVAVLNAHPYLKTYLAIKDGTLVQCANNDAEVVVKVYQVLEAEIEAIKNNFAQTFDLFQGPLYKISIYCTSEHTHLLLDFHHIIFDGGSMQLFQEDLLRAYNGLDLAPEKYTAFDLALDEENAVNSAAYLEAEKFFDQKLSHHMTKLPKCSTTEGIGQAKHVSVDLDKTAIDIFCKTYAITPNNLFLATLYYTLSKFTAEEDIAIATITNGRNENKLASIMGMLVKTLPAMMTIQPNKTALDFIKLTQQTMFEVFEHDIYPFTKMAAKHKFVPGIIYAYQGGLLVDVAIGTERVGAKTLTNFNPKFPLTINVYSDHENYQISLEYDDSLYNHEYIKSFGSAMAQCVNAMTIHPAKNLSELTLVSETDLKAMQSFNLTQIDYDNKCTSIVEMFKQQVERVPNNTAVVFGENDYTYKMLDAITDKLARKLKSLGVGREKAVGVMIERSEYMAIYPLAVLKAGGAYMPLDSTFPTERLEFMIKDANVTIILSEGDMVERALPNFEGIVIKTSDIAAMDVSEEIPLEIPMPNDMFIILFTSGSTGTPKGCILEHHSIANFCKGYQAYYSVTEKDRSAAYANFGFDASIMDLYPLITCGASVYIIPSAMRFDFIKLNQYLEDNHISIAFMTTQLGMQFVETFDNKSLRVLMIGGEKLLSIKKPSFKLYNAYGPTECTIYTTVYEIVEDYNSTIIGSPLDNYELYILDSHLQLLPIGAAGELCIGGAGVSRGYLNREELTKERFMTWNGKRLYRSGDLAKWNHEGQIEFIGRIDGQVKLRGLRIELGEIESQILKFSGITSCAVIVKDIGTTQQLCSYFTSSGEIDIEQLKEHLSKYLATFMIPTFFIRLESMPLTPNGKINKIVLPDPMIVQQEIIKPQTKIQQQLFELIANILGTDNFGINTDLFTMGMTSLLTIKISVAIYREFNVTIKTNDIIRSKTIAKLERTMQTIGPDQVVISYERREFYPLTENQNGIYYECEKQPEVLQYNIPFMLEFSDIHPQKLQEAVIQVINAHAYLNTHLSIQDEQIVQMANRSAEGACGLSKISEAEFEDRKNRFVKPFDLFKGPLYRIGVYYTEEYTYLLADFHHIIFDGSSLQIFLEELAKAYAGLELTEENYTAFELALDEEKTVKSDAYLKAEKFFDQKLSNHMTKLPKSSTTEGIGKAKHVVVDISNNAVDNFCKTYAITPNNLFLATLGYTLSKYTTEEVISIATITNGRSENKLTSIIGMLVKTLPVIMTIQQDNTALEFIEGTQQTLFDIFEHDIYPFTKMAAKHKFVPGIIYAYQDGILSDISIGSERVSIKTLTELSLKFALTINVYSDHENYQIALEYDDSLYNHDYIKSFGSAIAQCLNAMVTNPDQTLGKLSLISPEDKSKLLTNFQGNYLAYDKRATFLDLFAKQVQQRSEAIALVDATSKLTYSQTNAYADQLARKLVSLGVKANSFVGIMLPRQKEFMLSVLASMKAKGAYLPLDSSYPQERIEYMLNDSEAQVLITQRTLFEEKGGYDNFSTKHIVFIEEFDFLAATAATESAPHEELTRPVADDLAYMIYTSGSTGKPKGVMIRHKSLAAFLAWRINDYGLTWDDNICCHSSFSFDASVYDLFAPLVIGGQSHIISEDLRYDMHSFSEYLRTNKITDCILTTQFGMELLRQFDVPLKTITLGGEKLHHVPKRNLRLINAYGPTEFTIASNYYDVDQEKESDNIPIGKPVPNSWAYVVDSNNALLPIGMPGELCLSGLQIAKGYWHREELTEEKFVDNPYTTCEDNAKMYRTGDLVRWNENGELEYLGRIDNQVKLRGYRIELGEIEAAIASFNHIIASVVDIKEINSVQHLCGYFTAHTNIDVNELKEHLGRQLTAYMVPTVLMQMDQIQLTPNGKIDKKALPKPKLLNYHEYVAPTSELEAKLCDIFAMTLNIDKVGIDDSFFEIGGTSLLATKVVIKAMTNTINISYADVFKYQTPKKLGQYVNNKVEENSSSDNITNYDYTAINQLLPKNTLQQSDSMDIKEMGDILLTGATGFLGIHILHEFLIGHKGKAYCLIRPKANVDTEMRLKSLLVYYFENDYSELFNQRIFAIEGDITDKEILKNRQDVQADTVINCAANVKHFAVGSAIETINVDGVVNLINYCQEAGCRLIQVSTTSIAGESIDNVPPVDTVVSEAKLYVGQSLENKYINSKFLAERYVLEAVCKGLDAKIMRVGNLMSRDADGEFQINFNGNAYMARLKAYKLLGKFPMSAMGYEQEFSPIDSTAGAILKLAETKRDFTVFHPCNNHIVYLADIIYAMKEYGFAIDIVRDEEYEACVKEKMDDEKMAQALSGILAYNTSNTSQTISYLGTTNKFTTNVLYHLGFKWPVTSESYIKKAIEALDGLGFFDE